MESAGFAAAGFLDATFAALDSVAFATTGFFATAGFDAGAFCGACFATGAAFTAGLAATFFGAACLETTFAGADFFVLPAAFATTAFLGAAAFLFTGFVVALVLADAFALGADLAFFAAFAASAASLIRACCNCFWSAANCFSNWAMGLPTFFGGDFFLLAMSVIPEPDEN
jgi:hypothetical protein